MFKVAEVMTQDPLSLGALDTIQQAEELLYEHRIRQLPVVADSQLVGIITDRDIRSFLSGRLFSTPEERETALNTKVDAVMSTDPMTLSPDDDLRDAIELLIDEKIGGIPIVERDKKLVGIITYVDVLRCFAELLNKADGGA